MGRFFGYNRKKVGPVSVLGLARLRTLRMLMAWNPDRRSNFFSSPAHLCAVIYITEISLNVMLSKQYTHTQFKLAQFTLAL